MGKTGYYIGVIGQIICSIFYFLTIAALISDLAYFYDNQMFLGAEDVLFAGFFKQLILYSVIYIVVMFITRLFKSPYKRYKKSQKKIHQKS